MENINSENYIFIQLYIQYSLTVIWTIIASFSWMMELHDIQQKDRSKIY